MDYHAKIMNLKIGTYYDYPVDGDLTYKMGHRDARHGAAEIGIEADNEIKKLKAEIERKNGAIKNAMNALYVEYNNLDAVYDVLKQALSEEE